MILASHAKHLPDTRPVDGVVLNIQLQMNDMVVLVFPNKDDLRKLWSLSIKNNIGNQEEFLCAVAESIWPGHFHWDIRIVPGYERVYAYCYVVQVARYLEYSELPSWKSLPGSSL